MGVLYASEKLFVQKLLASYSVTHINSVSGTTFGVKDGLNMAFAFSGYEGDMSTMIEDDTIVTMRAELRKWSIPENSLETAIRIITLKTHICSAEELGVMPENIKEAKFSPIYAEHYEDVKRMVGRWRCFDDE